MVLKNEVFTNENETGGMDMLVLKNGQIWDGLGNDPYPADLLIEDGKIAKIAPDIHEEGAEVFAADGCLILPGFVDALNVYGCRGPGWDDNDSDEKTDPVRSDMSIVYAFDPDNMDFQELYTYGVTCSGITPTPTNVFAGTASVFTTSGRHPYKMLLKEDAAMIASVTDAAKKHYGAKNKLPMTRMGIFSILVETLHKAESYDLSKGRDSSLEALVPVVNGERPLFVNCATYAEMKGVTHAMKDFPKVKYVLTGAFNLDESFDEVRSGQVPVILGDVTDAFSPHGEEVRFKAVAELLKSGASIACASCSDSFASGKESLLWNGIQWYKNGIEANEVLKAMTHTPAEILGVGDITGSLEVGKRADIAVWSADPIRSYHANTKAVFLAGEDLMKKERRTSCW